MTSMPAAIREVFLHVHVRKCGGSTFHTQMLKRNFGAGYYRDASLLDDRYSAEQMSMILDRCDWLQAYSSHKISLDLPYERTSDRSWAIVFVRDPVARFLSHYFYLRNHPKSWDQRSRELTIAQYVEHAIANRLLETERQHGQLQHLVDIGGVAGMERVEAALRTGRVLLMPVERFDEACVLLEHRFPHSFRDCRYRDRINRSQIDQTPDETTRQQLRDASDEAEFRLWEKADGWLDRALAESIGDRPQIDAAVAAFRRRCRRRPWSLGWPFRSR